MECWRSLCQSSKLLHFLSPQPVDPICIQEYNLNSSSSFRIPGFSALRSDRTHSQSGILSPDAMHTSKGIVIFVRQGLSFSELSTSSLSLLDPYSDYVGINISLNNSSLVSFLNVYAPPPYLLLPNKWQNRFLLSLHFSLLQKSLHSGGLQLPSPPLGLKRYFRPPWGGSIRLGHLFWPPPLNDPDTPTLFHCSSGSRSSPNISFAPPTLALSCSWEMLQDLGSDHLLIILSVPLSPVYCLNKRPTSFNFQKACWDGFASYFDSHCPSAEEYSSPSLSCAAALFTSLTLNAAKSSIPFSRIKRPSKAWWSASSSFV